MNRINKKIETSNIMKNIENRSKMRNLGMLSGLILFAILITAPAIADTGIFTGCLKVKQGIINNIQAGTSPTSACLKGDIVISFYNNSIVDTLQTQVDSLQDQITVLQELLSNITRTGNDIHITGANIHIESGSGSTDGTVNGLGNLIIGYNEGASNIVGSHNLVIGKENNYLSYGGIIAGNKNTISGPFSSVSGGLNNTASGVVSSVSGGLNNKASSIGASVSGGEQNTAGGIGSSVSGGKSNIASGGGASISGGSDNTATGDESSISGGFHANTGGTFNWAAGSSGQNFIGQFYSLQ